MTLVVVVVFFFAVMRQYQRNCWAVVSPLNAHSGTLKIINKGSCTSGVLLMSVIWIQSKEIHITLSQTCFHYYYMWLNVSGNKTKIHVFRYLSSYIKVTSQSFRRIYELWRSLSGTSSVNSLLSVLFHTALTCNTLHWLCVEFLVCSLSVCPSVCVHDQVCV